MGQDPGPGLDWEMRNARKKRWTAIQCSVEFGGEVGVGGHGGGRVRGIRIVRERGGDKRKC